MSHEVSSQNFTVVIIVSIDIKFYNVCRTINDTMSLALTVGKISSCSTTSRIAG